MTKYVTITKEMIEDAIGIVEYYDGRDDECFADESVVSTLMEEYGLHITDAHAALEEAQLIYETRKAEATK